MEDKLQSATAQCFDTETDVTHADCSESWQCSCGQLLHSKRKRCGHCFRWKGGVKPSLLAARRKKEKEEQDPVVKRKKSKDERARKSFSKATGGVASKPKNKRSKSAKQRNVPESTDHEYLQTNRSFSTIDHTIIETTNPKECAQRWKAILKIRDQRKALHFSSPLNHSENSNEFEDVFYNNQATEKHDPFDCSDLIVHPISVLVEKEVSKAIDRWKDLDSRIIVEDDDSLDQSDDIAPGDGNTLVFDGTMGGDGRRQRILPPNFDYLCSSRLHDTNIEGHTTDTNENSQSLIEQQKYYRPKVISLLDPTQRVDYEAELWHIFHSMPTASELEKLHGLCDSKSEEEHNGSCHGCQYTYRLKNELKASLTTYTRIDAHSLGRLRVRDRHQIDFSTQCSKTNTPFTSTIRFEILRYSVNLKRGSGPDSNRFEVEFSGSKHTLLDVHRVLVECANTSGGGIFYEDSIKSGGEKVLPAGIFFIENNFYHFGEIGDKIGGTILEWLNGEVKKKSARMEKNEKINTVDPTHRRQYLCISSKNKSIPMSNVLLEDLPLRLGVRYFYMLATSTLFHEFTLFVTDIRTHNTVSFTNQESSDNNSNTFPMPMIHDVWTSPKQTTVCVACNFAVATIVTINDELTDLSLSLTSANIGHKFSSSTEYQGVPLCGSCFRELHYQHVSDEEMMPSPVLKLRQSHQPFMVLPLEEFDRMILAKAIKETPIDATF